MFKPAYRKAKNLLTAQSLYGAINPIRWAYYTKIKGYTELPLDDAIRHGVYQVFLKPDGDELSVVKIPRKDTYFSQKFVRRIQHKEGYADFCRTITSLCDLEYISRHLGEVKEIRPDGGYISPLINGYNLAQMLSGSVLLYPVNRKQFERSAEELLENLERFLNRFGYIHGDWALHNLIYDDSLHRILNVDLEGFFMYRSGEVETRLDRIQDELLKVKQRILQSEERHRGNSASQNGSW